MAWPTPQDYNEAIQNPSLAFDDPELRTGAVETTALGLPRPITGNFASVYRMRCGSRDWAVRCFWREYADLRARYAAISAHLKSARLPYTVSFEYLPQGIRVRGVWYPVLKMEWVEGPLLSEYVAQKVGDPASLEKLAGAWRSMTDSLHGTSIAHGDLQHGNVLVVNGALKLVDYDGMYVPALLGRQSHELGHQNYQHPARDESTFGPGTDRFSAWVIHLSLIALARQPDLWQRPGAGDECLLLRQDDYRSPDSSATFQLLLGHADPEIRTAAERLRASLAEHPDRLPSLTVQKPARQAGALAAPNLPSPARIAWRTLVPAPPRLALAHAVAAPSGALPSWLADHYIPQPRTAEFASAPPYARLARWLLPAAAPAAVILALVAHLGWVASLTLAAASALLGSLLVLLAAYHHDPAVRDMKAVLRRESKCSRALRSAGRRQASLEREHDRLLARARQARAGNAERRRKLLRMEQRDRAWADEIRTVQLDALHERIRCLEKAQAEKLAAALRARQERHVRSFLRRQKIYRARIPGVSLMFTVRLWLRGIRAAADLDVERIRASQDLGEATLLALVTWRVAMEREARATTPRKLDESHRARLARPTDRKLRRLRTRASTVEGSHDGHQSLLDHRYSGKRDRIEASMSQTENRVREATKEIDAAMRTFARESRGLEAEIAACREEYAPFITITFRRFLAHAVR